jgi:NitT/TauT family transport system substrate-binding protein
MIAGSAAVALAPSPAQSADPVTLRLDWTALGYHAPFVLGEARGYYKDRGLDLKILEGKGSSTGIQLVATGSDTFAFADASAAAKLIGNGTPVKVVMGLIQRSPLSITFRHDRGIAKPADLKGKTIATCASTGGTALLPAYLEAVGLKSADVNLVNTDCSAYFPLVAQGKADASISYFPQAKSILRNLGVNEVDRLEFAAAGVVLPSHGIVASTKLIHDNPDVIRRFVAATAAGWQDARRDPAAAVAALTAKFPLLKGKEATLQEELKDTMLFLETPNTQGHPFGWQSPKDWQRAEEILTKYMGLTKAASPDVYYTDAFVAN